MLVALVGLLLFSSGRLLHVRRRLEQHGNAISTAPSGATVEAVAPHDGDVEALVSGGRQPKATRWPTGRTVDVRKSMRPPLPPIATKATTTTTRRHDVDARADAAAPFLTPPKKSHTSRPSSPSNAAAGTPSVVELRFDSLSDLIAAATTTMATTVGVTLVPARSPFPCKTWLDAEYDARTAVFAVGVTPLSIPPSWDATSDDGADDATEDLLRRLQGRLFQLELAKPPPQPHDYLEELVGSTGAASSYPPVPVSVPQQLDGNCVPRNATASAAFMSGTLRLRLFGGGPYLSTEESGAITLDKAEGRSFELFALRSTCSSTGVTSIDASIGSTDGGADALHGDSPRIMHWVQIVSRIGAPHGDVPEGATEAGLVPRLPITVTGSATPLSLGVVHDATSPVRTKERTGDTETDAQRRCRWAEPRCGRGIRQSPPERPIQVPFLRDRPPSSWFRIQAFRIDGAAPVRRPLSTVQNGGCCAVLATTFAPLVRLSPERRFVLVGTILSWYEELMTPPNDVVYGMVTCTDHGTDAEGEATLLRSTLLALGVDSATAAALVARVHFDTQCESIAIDEATLAYTVVTGGDGRRREPSLLTYRGVFAAAARWWEQHRLTSSPAADDGGDGDDAAFILFTNADIIFPAATGDGATPGGKQCLPAALRWAHQQRTHRTVRSVFITGRRRNCDAGALVGAATRLSVGLANEASGGVDPAVHKGRWVASHLSHCELFGDDAQDYFILPMSGMVRFAAASPGRVFTVASPAPPLLPPLVIGGIAFDNFLVAVANRLDTCLSVDATPAVLALHINHGTDVRASHHSVKSQFNSKLAHGAGGWAKGKTSLTDAVMMMIADASTGASHQHHAWVVPRGVAMNVLPRHAHHFAPRSFYAPPETFASSTPRSGEPPMGQSLPDVDILQHKADSPRYWLQPPKGTDEKKTTTRCNSSTAEDHVVFSWFTTRATEKRRKSAPGPPDAFSRPWVRAD